jgi:type II secretory pathway pseudopilin PulG
MRTRSTRAAREAGTTLLEVLVATAVMALLMMAVLGVVTGTSNARSRIQAESSSRSVGPAILDMIANDVQGVYFYAVENSEGFLGEDREEGGMPADRLNMITTSDSLSYERISADEERSSDVCEVGYTLVSSPHDTRYLALYRREEFTPAGDPYRGGVYRMLYDRVAALDTRYFAGTGEEDEEGEDEWASAEALRLPRSMEILLRVDVAPEGEEPRIEEYRRLIAFAPGTDVEVEDPQPLFKPDAAQRGAGREEKGDGEGEGGSGGGGKKQQRGGGRQGGGQKGRGGSDVDDIFGDG